MTTAMKPPPWKCGTCRARAVVPAVIPCYQAEIDHDGRTYTVSLPDLSVLRCEQCGAIVLDDAADLKISQALRRQAGLLTPEEIREQREALGLTQKQLAGQLGIADATLSRWETGAQIQQRSLDRFLRVLFTFPSVRAVLARDSLPPLAPNKLKPTSRVGLKPPPDLKARAAKFRLMRARQAEPAHEPSPVPADSEKSAQEA